MSEAWPAANNNARVDQASSSHGCSRLTDTSSSMMDGLGDGKHGT